MLIVKHIFQNNWITWNILLMPLASFSFLIELLDNIIFLLDSLCTQFSTLITLRKWGQQPLRWWAKHHLLMVQLMGRLEANVTQMFTACWFWSVRVKMVFSATIFKISHVCIWHNEMSARKKKHQGLFTKQPHNLRGVTSVFFLAQWVVE